MSFKLCLCFIFIIPILGDKRITVNQHTDDCELGRTTIIINSQSFFLHRTFGRAGKLLIAIFKKLSIRRFSYFVTLLRDHLFKLARVILMQFTILGTMTSMILSLKRYHNQEEYSNAC